MEGNGELIGIVVALVILVLAFGSVVGAGLPIGVALVGLGVGSGGITLLAATMDVSTAAPTVATMVGLGVGIDYALLLVTRHVGVPARRATTCPRPPAGPPPPPAARSCSPPRTVLVSLHGPAAGRAADYASFGFATAIAVGRRGRRRAHPGAGAVPARRPPAAAPQGRAAGRASRHRRRSR